MFKCTSHKITPFLNILFNNILQTGLFPPEWSETVITPVHKKGPKDDPNNYRAISLINSISKVFIKVLTNRLNWPKKMKSSMRLKLDFIAVTPLLTIYLTYNLSYSNI